MKKWFFAVALFSGAILGADEAGKDYFNPLNERDKSNLTYLVETLSEHNMLALAMYKSELEKRGMETDRIHVLSRLAFIFSNPKLKEDTKKIDRGPWRRFARDFGKSLEKADANGEITPEIIADFTKKTGANPKEVDSFVQNKDWTGLMNYLREGTY